MQPSPELEKFSFHFKNSLLTAGKLAGEFGHQLIEPLHIFYGILNERGSIAGEFLINLKFDLIDIKSFIQTEFNSQLTDQLIIAELSPLSKTIIIKALKNAYEYKSSYTGTEHLLKALLSINDTKVNKLLKKYNFNPLQLSQQTSLILKTTAKLPEILENFKDSSDKQKNEYNYKENSNILDYFGKNLTNSDFAEKIDPVIGRETEIKRIIEILGRRSKNNPLLIGEPGVGKTAIIEGLAKKIALSQAPSNLNNKKIYSLDLSSIVAGTSFRGEFESRLKDIIAEVENRDDVILFIDEIHQIIGGGSASGSMDAANILKPALARGEIKIIGATTYHDYRKSIENDKALARRFQAVKINEPSPNQATQILLGIKSYLENFHQVRISPEAIIASVELSHRYLNDKFLPDKAIDLLDEASSALKTNKKISATELALKEISQKSFELKKDIHNLIIEENFEQASEIKKSIITLEQQLIKINKKIASEKLKKASEVKAKDIEKLITKITGIPINEVTKSNKKKIIKLEKTLKKEIIGQDLALNSILKHLKLNAIGLSSDLKPLASLLLIGPSGVGKTYTAQVLAKEFFGSEQALIRLDMSEYSEKFNASKLIGAPAGYVGYKESGQLTEKIKRQPYSLILLDEIEKADQSIFNLLLQIFDNGYLTDASGELINFRNTIIIMTSNIGAEFYNDKKNIGFEKYSTQASNQEKLISKELKKHFKPEFLNRLNDIIFFNQLTEADLKTIIEKELIDITEKIARQNQVKIIIEKNIEKELIKIISKDQPEKLNARLVQNQVKLLLENILIEKLINKPPLKLKTLRLKAKNGIITLT